MTALPGLYKRIHSEAAARLNTALLKGFEQFAGAPETRRSHYFSGRYENIYISAEQLPAYAELLGIAREHAAAILGTSPQKLKAGGWFNAMGPGQATLMHSHDDNDEVLSAVYYVTAPDNSGVLVLMGDEGPVKVSPEAGSFVFFDAALDHEVSENRSDGLRLSIGMNFGYVED